MLLAQSPPMILQGLNLIPGSGKMLADLLQSHAGPPQQQNPLKPEKLIMFISAVPMGADAGRHQKTDRVIVT